MRSKAGLRTNETAKDSDLDWLDSASQDYSDVEDCDDWRFDFYAIDKHTYKYVMGFDDEWECEKYCSENSYRKKTLKQALASAKKPYLMKNWSNDYSRKGLI